MRIPFEKDKLKLWSAVCIISAIPSFYWALEVRANIPAMLVGIVLFIFGYTAITSSDFYKKQKQKIFWFAAMKLAFKVRIFYSLLSIATIILFAPNVRDVGGKVVWINIADWYLGTYSVAITEFLLDNGSFRILGDVGTRIDNYVNYVHDSEFFPILVVTITQGILLSLAILLLAVIIWCFLRVKNIVSLNKMVKI
jgi:hypothetical protein